MLEGVHVAGDADGIVVLHDGDARLDQLLRDGLQVLRDDVPDQDVALGGGGGDHIGAGLDLIRDDRVIRAVELLYAVDLDHVGAGAVDVRAEGVEKVREIDDMRFLRHIFEDRQALGFYGGEHDVDGRADGDDVEIDVPPEEVLGLDADKAVPDVDGRAQRLKTLDMLVDRADAEVASAGQGNVRLAEPSHQRAEKVIGGPELAGEILRHLVGAQVARINEDGGAADGANRRAHDGQDFKQMVDIADFGYIFKETGPLRKNGCRDNGDGGVFCPADGDFPAKRFSAVDDIFLQSFRSPLRFTIIIIISYEK